MSILDSNRDDAGVWRSFSDSRPSHFIKPLHSFSLLTEDSLANTAGKLEFEDFEAGGYQWKLVLYPNGHKKKNVEHHISLYLVMAGENSLQPGWDVYVDFRLFLLDQNNGKYLVLEDAFTKNFCFRHEMPGAAGFDKLIPLNYFTDASNGYLVDDTCVFGAEVFVCKETRPPKVCHSIIKPTSETYKHVWKIQNLSKIGDDTYSEEPFTAGGRKWIIQLHPGGFNNGIGTVLMSVSIWNWLNPSQYLLTLPYALWIKSIRGIIRELFIIASLPSNLGLQMNSLNWKISEQQTRGL